jgi:hypothetical protein
MRKDEFTLHYCLPLNICTAKNRNMSVSARFSSTSMSDDNFSKQRSSAAAVAITVHHIRYHFLCKYHGAALSLHLLRDAAHDS